MDLHSQTTLKEELEGLLERGGHLRHVVAKGGSTVLSNFTSCTKVFLNVIMPRLFLKILLIIFSHSY